MTRACSAALAAGLLLSVPAGARAAAIDSGRPCYANGEAAAITGAGFTPDSPVSFTVNGRPIAANVTSDAQGAFEASYTPPATPTQARLRLRATDSGGTTARTTLYVTRELRVTANPDQADNVRTWRAVFRLFGFGHGTAFVHYVGPNGRLRKTVRLGRLERPCGRLKTARRRVLPFANPDFGRWKLQFDTRRRYRPRTARRRVIPVRVYRG